MIFTVKNTECDSDIHWKNAECHNPEDHIPNIRYRDNLNLTESMIKMIKNGAVQISFPTLVEI